MTRTRVRRPITIDEILRVGRDLGLDRLSLNAVATELGVTTTALYRHVDGRWGLERLVGESLLAELVLHDDPADDLERHLVAFGLQLRAFTRTHPGLASYLQLLFPRGESGTGLLADEVDALTRRGYAVDAAMVLSGAVASVSIAVSASEERRAEATEGAQRGSFEAEEQATAERVGADPRFAAAVPALPVVSTPEYVGLLLAASVRGMVAAAPPGRPVDEVMASLSRSVN
ncbi:MAG: TetR/AcrR family transcriptional regulator [Propionibacteriaceae bacterium]